MTKTTGAATMKRLFSYLTILLSFSLPLAAQEAAGPTAVKDPRGAIEFVETLATETQAVWSDAKLTSEERSGAFRALFQEATDINLLARGMLGRHYLKLKKDKAKRDAYMAAMEDYIVAEFDKRMAQIGFESLEVVGTKPASGKRGHLFVKTEVIRADGDPILADWRIRKKNGEFQIVNLEFEGINLMITNRDVFSAKVKKVGIDGLITWLKGEAAATLTASASN
jgi:phospholipid transport system substrate-binding protein